MQVLFNIPCFWKKFMIVKKLLTDTQYSISYLLYIYFLGKTYRSLITPRSRRISWRSQNLIWEGRPVLWTEYGLDDRDRWPSGSGTSLRKPRECSLLIGQFFSRHSFSSRKAKNRYVRIIKESAAIVWHCGPKISSKSAYLVNLHHNTLLASIFWLKGRSYWKKLPKKFIKEPPIYKRRIVPFFHF